MSSSVVVVVVVVVAAAGAAICMGEGASQQYTKRCPHLPTSV